MSQHGEQSVIGAAQVYSDKSQTTLGAHEIYFYSLHVPLLYFTEEWHRENVCSRRTIFAYSSVQNKPYAVTTNTSPAEFQEIVTITRLLFLYALQCSINISTKRLADASLCELPV